MVYPSPTTAAFMTTAGTNHTSIKTQVDQNTLSSTSYEPTPLSTTTDASGATEMDSVDSIKTSDGGELMYIVIIPVYQTSLFFILATGIPISSQAVSGPFPTTTTHKYVGTTVGPAPTSISSGITITPHVTPILSADKFVSFKMLQILNTPIVNSNFQCLIKVD